MVFHMIRSLLFLLNPMVTNINVPPFSLTVLYRYVFIKDHLLLSYYENSMGSLLLYSVPEI